MDASEKENNWKCQETWPINAVQEQFWISMDIYTKRSNVVNRRTLGEEILGFVKLLNEFDVRDVLETLSTIDPDSDISKLKLIHSIEEIKDIKIEDIKESQGKVAVIKRVITKNTSNKLHLEVIVNDYLKNFVSFYSVGGKSNSVPDFPYGFSYKESRFGFWVQGEVLNSNSSYQWIVGKLVPKLIKWMKTADNCNTESGSLRLVPVTEYSLLYHKMKDSYGKQLVEMWPENTDPLKFVYEDIGIATYLLLLWADKPKQRFVDLGCGNGLLVHILNSEGHLGVGYDLKSRKIWSMYPPSTKLEVKAIIPSSETLFPDIDWIIGNHSDELTVWIPVMAAQSSFSCNFFLLPCCPYNFDGSKYQRSDTSVSQYSDFLSYVESVCRECGIVVKKDKLRIPSTKRTCFVGTTREYEETDWKDSINKLNSVLHLKFSVKCDSKVWNSKFKPREDEKVRNCTQVCSEIREKIFNIVVEQLLAKRRQTESGWSYSGVVDISDLAKIIPSDTLKQLKKECGGLQTLLKNHHFIFQVQKGKVEFRVPAKKVRTENSVWKKKQCWFFHNHPDSCPLSDDSCSFIHT